MKRLFLLALVALASVQALDAQVFTLGADPVGIKWKSLESEHFRIVYPEAADSLAREYVKSLESFNAAQKFACGFSPNEMYRRKMPVILHTSTAESNGLVTWAPRRMELFATAESLNPESTPWITQLAVHEGRHVAQMQFPRANRLFRPLEWFVGELSTGAASGMYPGPALLEGDAVVAETALTNTGRGRTADFLEYYHVALADSLYRDFWQWRYGSQKRYTPDYYRAGYMLIGGMRTAFSDTLFTRRYFEYINERRLPFKVLEKNVILGTKHKKNLYMAFNAIQDAFRQEWAEADSARAPFFEGRPLVRKGRLFDSYNSLVFTEEGLFALHAGLDRPRELVRIDSTGRVEHLGAFAGNTSRLAWDKFNRRLLWTEIKPYALFPMGSWSVLRYLEEDGGPQTFKLSERIFNPAPSTETPVIAVAEYYEDGRNSIRLLSAKTGTPFEEYFAPAGMQPVEPVWIGENLYASAITEDGFSIYRVPGWDPLFAPAHSKINRLFARDSLIWFTSDRSGVNELHSLDPASGEMLQRTSLRFGGSEFAFSPSGELYYSALTPGGREVRVLDTLLSRPVAFGAYYSASAEMLSAQEPSGAVPYDGPISEGKPYSKPLQPVRPHSWMPVYFEYNPVERLSLEETMSDARAGATLMFQNELGTAYGSIGVSLFTAKDTLGTGYTIPEGELGLPVEFRPALHAQYVWRALGPIVELRADYNERNVHRRDYTRVSTEKGMNFPETYSIGGDPLLSLSAGISVPFNLNGSGWNRGIIPSYRLSWSNDKYSSLDIQQYTNSVIIKIVPHESMLLSKFSVRAYATRPIAPSGIFPRLGAGGEIGFTRTHNLGSNTPGYYYAKVYGYLPGLMGTHGLRLSAEGRSNYGWEGSWIKKQEYQLRADYAFPFLPLDWSGMCPYFYVRNFEAVLHGGATIGAFEELLRVNKDSYLEPYAGATLRVHLGNFLWAPYDTYLGFRYLYNFADPSKSGFEVVYSLDI